MRCVISSLLAVVGLAIGAGPAAAGVVAEYRMLVDGVHSDYHVLDPGRHTLSIEVLVSGNDLGLLDLGLPGGHQQYYGGLLMYSLNLKDTQDQVEFPNRYVEFVNSVPLKTPYPGWDSTAPAAFCIHFPGLLDVRLKHRPGEFYDVFAETGLIWPDNHGTYFTTFGGGSETDPPAWTELVQGEFDWTGLDTELVLEPYSDDSTLVFGRKDEQRGYNVWPGFGPVVPDEVIGETITLGSEPEGAPPPGPTPVPEPGTLVLLGAGLLAIALWRRRQQNRA